MTKHWFRLHAEFSFDPIIQSLSFDDQRHFLVLLCLKHNGTLDRKMDRKVRERVICRGLGLDPETSERVRATLLTHGLIDSSWSPADWDRYSPAPDRPLSHIWNDLRSRIFKRDDYTCAYCGARGVRLECDHVIPVSRGGSHEESNLVTACFSCNRSKRDKLVKEWRP